MIRIVNGESNGGSCFEGRLDDAYYDSPQTDHESFSKAIDGTPGANRGDLGHD